MNLRKKGMLSLIGAIAVFATASVCFSNCSSEDDFGEMEEMEFTMASKKMTRAGENLDDYTSFWGIPVMGGDTSIYNVLVDEFYCDIYIHWTGGFTGTLSNTRSFVYFEIYAKNEGELNRYINFKGRNSRWNDNHEIELEIDYDVEQAYNTNNPNEPYFKRVIREGTYRETFSVNPGIDSTLYELKDIYLNVDLPNKSDLCKSI